MNIEEARQVLRDKLDGKPPLGAKLKFELDGDYILIDGSGSKNIVTDQNDKADCTLIMSFDTYLKFQEGKVNPVAALFTGKLKVKGNKLLARKLGDIT
jgi:putative sterol carrier protein